jgi:tetratricopeptide (TPR) repeat protein
MWAFLQRLFRWRKSAPRGTEGGDKLLPQSAISSSGGPSKVEPPAAELLPYDAALLERARSQWQLGDWKSLAKLNCAELEHHPDRAKLALLAAVGRMQVGDKAEARRYFQIAKEWGCDKKLISRVMIAAVHDSLARAYLIEGNNARAVNHFQDAVRVALPNIDFRLLGEQRAIRAAVQLGMKTKIAELVAENPDTSNRIPYGTYYRNEQ